VINLSTDKDQVFREAFRVLKPGGRWAVADVIALEELPEAVRKDLEAYAGCIGGALVLDDYRKRLEEAGFVDVEFQILRSYGLDDFGGGCCGADAADSSEGKLASAFIRARKP
jgi:arsenite methyltransferase